MKIGPREISVRIRRLVVSSKGSVVGLDGAIAAAISARLSGAKPESNGGPHARIAESVASRTVLEIGRAGSGRRDR